MTSTLRGGGGWRAKAKMRCYQTEGGGGLASVLDVQSLSFLLKKSGFGPWPDISLTRNLPFDSDASQWSHPLMVPLHCLWVRTRGQFECDVTLFFCCCFCLTSFIHMHGAIVVP